MALKSDPEECGPPPQPARAKVIVFKSLGLATSAALLWLVCLLFGVPFVNLRVQDDNVSLPRACAREGQHLGVILVACGGVLGFAAGLYMGLIGRWSAVASRFLCISLWVLLIGAVVWCASGMAGLLLRDFGF
jgi:hypothetical protein